MTFGDMFGVRGNLEVGIDCLEAVAICPSALGFVSDHYLSRCDVFIPAAEVSPQGENMDENMDKPNRG